MADINVTAVRIKNINARIRQVFANRKYYGDLSQFTSSAIFSVDPTTGSIILKDQGTKVVDMILKVAPVGSLKKIANDSYILRDLTVIENFLTTLEGQTATTSTNSCGTRGGCTGICVAHCSTACKGDCKTSCTSNCFLNGCTSKCINTCSGCLGSCSGSCFKDCSTGCTSGCKST